MIENPNTTAAPRRSILSSALAIAATAGASVAAAAAPAASLDRFPQNGEDGADAELLNLSREYVELEHHYQGLYGEGPRPDLRVEGFDAREAVAGGVIRPRQAAIMERLNVLRATTVAGLTARVEMLASMDGGILDCQDEEDGRIVLDLVRDIRALGAGGAA